MIFLLKSLLGPCSSAANAQSSSLSGLGNERLGETAMKGAFHEL
jgi:hypothetical protein